MMIEASCFPSPPPLSPLPRLGVHLRSHDERHVGVAARSLHDHGGESRNPYLSAAAASRAVRRLWPRGSETEASDVGVLPSSSSLSSSSEEEEEEDNEISRKRRRRRTRGNWVLKILRVRAIWEKEKEEFAGDGGEEEDVKRMLEMGDRRAGCCDGKEGCVVGDADEEEMEFDRDSFSRLLRRASLEDAKLYAKLSYLGSLAYSIPKIQTGNLLKYHGLRFVTSSLERKSKASAVERKQQVNQNKLSKTSNVSKAKPFVKNQSLEKNSKDPSATEDQAIVHNQPTESGKEAEETKIHSRNSMSTISSSYRIVVSAASYLQSQTKSILSFRQTKANVGTDSPEDVTDSEKASFVVTTDSVTAVVAGKEEMKEAFSKELKNSSPCEWFACDDESSGTRYFVIQGSESLASWQANLLFEPVQFEGMDVFVHRGIYEAAKGIYEQMLPEVRSHLQSRGKAATLRFTGHSLGGSLSLLVNLMLLIRGEAPASSLLPVITFGAPSIMCGGNYLLQKLGLPLSHIQAITLHRDIVPRAFSCTYPERVKEILKAVNGNFRSHPCLTYQNLLYLPMGEILILQPDEKYSPNHHLLPSGSGLYFLSQPSESVDSRRLLRSALSAFLNSPHPLEILSDRTAYGYFGAVTRDHDMTSYLRSVQCVIMLERRRVMKAKRERQRKLWWPFLVGTGAGGSSGLFHGGSESFKRIVRLVTSRQTHWIVVLILPAREIFFEAFTVGF